MEFIPAISRFNPGGVDGLIVKKQSDKLALINWKKILERLTRAILDVINHLKRFQKTDFIGP